MSIDDGLFIELRIGDRMRRSITEWEGMAKGMLSPDAINKEKEEEGDRKDEQLFLGFVINASSMTIAFPGEKRAGATVLFGELFRQFGSRIMRPLTIRRLRGNIERFRTTNILWSFPPAP